MLCYCFISLQACWGGGVAHLMLCYVIVLFIYRHAGEVVYVMLYYCLIYLQACWGGGVCYAILLSHLFTGLLGRWCMLCYVIVPFIYRHAGEVVFSFQKSIATLWQALNGMHMNKNCKFKISHLTVSTKKQIKQKKTTTYIQTYKSSG